MPAAEKSTVIKATPDKIWGIATDPNNWHTWFEGTTPPKSVEGDGGEGTVVEIQMTVANIPIPAKVTVVETKPGERWKGTFTAPVTEGFQEWTYQPMGDRTKLTLHIEAELSGPAKLAEGMVVKSFEDIADKTLIKLRELAEA
jgi:carbon monoxide dehydrogenase subunit G